MKSACTEGREVKRTRSGCFDRFEVVRESESVLRLTLAVKGLRHSPGSTSQNGKLRSFVGFLQSSE